MFDWNDYLKFAKAQGLEADEIFHRCAISRAYYAVYNLACQQIIKLNITQKPSPPNHIWVWKAFYGYRSRESKNIAKMGYELKEMREQADYEDVIPDIKTLFVDAIKLADDLLLEINMFG